MFVRFGYEEGVGRVIAMTRAYCVFVAEKAYFNGRQGSPYRMFQVGEETALKWDHIFATIEPPATPVTAEDLRKVSQAVYRPTCQAPRTIRRFSNLTAFDGTSPASCVYFLCHLGKVVYVGQSTALASRLTKHAKDKTFDCAFYIPMKFSDALNREVEYIRRLTPLYNCTHNDPAFVRSKRKTTIAVHVPTPAIGGAL